MKSKTGRACPAPNKKSKLGRPEKNWKDLCVIIGAYIIKHNQVSPRKKLKSRLASETDSQDRYKDDIYPICRRANNQGGPVKYSFDGKMISID